jgi:hypothetical protein
MIRNHLWALLYAGALTSLFAGCGDSGSSGAVLAEGGGVVNFKGGPLAGASVTFIPDDGPIATGTTDLQGKFKLSTGAVAGVAVGSCKVTITAFEGGAASTAAPATADVAKMSKPPSAEDAKRMLDPSAAMLSEDKAGKSSPKSIINMKYASAETSGLTATVSKDSSKNQFPFTVEE